MLHFTMGLIGREEEIFTSEDGRVNALLAVKIMARPDTEIMD